MKCRLDGLDRQFGSGLLMQADQFGGPRGVGRFQLRFCANALAADHQIVFTAQIRAHQCLSFFHPPAAFGQREICIRLVTKLR
jgi:hypothetical protein